jgi:hypothetical protein
MKAGVVPIGVCDVWDSQEDEYEQEFGGKVTRRKYAQGLFPSAKKVGLNPDDRKHVVKDYRRLLELPEIDAVCIATPDHWHAKMAIDAAEAGNHIYIEKPMTRTLEEAQAVVEAMVRHNIVMTVGVQSMADPADFGQRASAPVASATSLSADQLPPQRHPRSMALYRLTKEMTPKTVDWKMFLVPIRGRQGRALAPIPFSTAAFGQWRVTGRSAADRLRTCSYSRSRT